jgi:hypothetical protein
MREPCTGGFTRGRPNNNRRRKINPFPCCPGYRSGEVSPANAKCRVVVPDVSDRSSVFKWNSVHAYIAPRTTTTRVTIEIAVISRMIY